MDGVMGLWPYDCDGPRALPIKSFTDARELRVIWPIPTVPGSNPTVAELFETLGNHFKALTFHPGQSMPAVDGSISIAAYLDTPQFSWIRSVRYSMDHAFMYSTNISVDY